MSSVLLCLFVSCSLSPILFSGSEIRNISLPVYCVLSLTLNESYQISSNSVLACLYSHTLYRVLSLRFCSAAVRLETSACQCIVFSLSLSTSPTKSPATVRGLWRAASSSWTSGASTVWTWTGSTPCAGRWTARLDLALTVTASLTS